MTTRSSFLTEPVAEYLSSCVHDEPPLLQALRTETQGLEGAGMQISADQGRFMQLMVELLGAKRALEIGVYTGYSSLCVALALPSDGYLLACDISDEWTQVARRYWHRAGVAERIELRLAPATETLDSLLSGPIAEPFDIAFIDADKTSYDAYYERCLRLLRPGGLIIFDNALWGGRVAEPEDQSPDTLAIRSINRKVVSDPRVRASLVAVGDGLLLACKRSAARIV